MLRPGWSIGLAPRIATGQSAPAPERPKFSSTRSELRSPADLTFAVCGLSSTGRFFVELCSTVNISRSGCCLRLNTQPQANSALVLRAVPGGTSLPAGTSQLLFQLAWMRAVDGGWQIGAFSLSNVDLFRLIFPFGAL